MLKIIYNHAPQIIRWLSLITISLGPALWGYYTGWFLSLPPLVRLVWILTVLSSSLVFAVIAVKSFDFFKERFFPNRRPMPLLSVFLVADKNGWDILNGSLHILDLIDALREAGHSGEIKFRGKLAGATDFDSLTRNKPFTDIPKEQWIYLNIDYYRALRLETSPIKGKYNNYEMNAFTNGLSPSKMYKDVHVIVPNLKSWLKVARKEYLGRRQFQSQERQRMWDAYDEERNGISTL